MEILDQDYEYYSDVYPNAVETCFDNATCCTPMSLDMYDRITPLYGPECMFRAIKVAETITWFCLIFGLGSAL